MNAKMLHNSKALMSMMANQIKDLPPREALAVVAGASCKMFHELGGDDALQAYADLVEHIGENHAEPPTGEHWN